MEEQRGAFSIERASRRPSAFFARRIALRVPRCGSTRCRYHGGAARQSPASLRARRQSSFHSTTLRCSVRSTCCAAPRRREVSAGLQERPFTVAEAYAALEDFARSAGVVRLRLLLHAAVPQTFRADLLNLL